LFYGYLYYMKQIILEEIKKIITERVMWTKELVQKRAEKYSSKGEFQKKDLNAYNAAKRNGWFDDVTTHMVIVRNINWTYDDIFRIAQNYDRLIDFKNSENAAFLYAKRHGFIDDVISHMKRNIRWDKDKIHNISLKYGSRSEFEKNDPNAYNSALRMGIMDDVTQHMQLLGNRYKRMIYVYEFSDKYFYVGLTYNQNKRNYNHLRDVRSSVNQHMLKTGLTPILKKITEYITNDEAVQKENEILNQYINNGWKPLNKRKTGGLGGNLQKWSKDKVMSIVKKYTKLKDFRNNEPRAWESAVRNDWYDDVIKDLEKTIKVKKYTRELLEKIIKNYKTLTEFREKEASAYGAILTNKWYDLIENLKRKEHPWTNFDNVKQESEKYKTRKEFSQNSPGAYNSALKNGWLNNVTKHMESKFVWTKDLVNDVAKKYDNYTDFVEKIIEPPMMLLKEMGG
jgi:predicted GIY-YIG superfamily endonuclease